MIDTLTYELNRFFQKSNKLEIFTDVHQLDMVLETVFEKDERGYNGSVNPKWVSAWSEIFMIAQETLREK